MWIARSQNNHIIHAAEQLKLRQKELAAWIKNRTRQPDGISYYKL